MGAGTSPYMGPVNSGAMGNLTSAYNVRTVSQHKYTAFFLRKRAFVLGANVKELTETERQASSLPMGVTVISVVEDSPADRAGILPGDILTEVEGKTFGTEAEYQKLLNALSGGPVHISLVRHGAEQTVVTRLNPLPPQR
jgi:serine protease Do